MRKHLFGVVVPVLLTALVAGHASAQSRVGRTTLDIYVVDVEGGNATLFVAPTGESLLIDTGNPGKAAVRDAERILAAAKDAGITELDHLITTHYHADHMGGIFEVAKRIPIRHFIDHGPNVQPGRVPEFDTMYPQLWANAKHTVAKPGDQIALGAVQARIVTSAGNVIQSAVPGGGQANPLCTEFKPKMPDAGENALSVGTHFTFGRFRTVMLGDLTWNKEAELTCPTNRLGTVDLYLVSHHGLIASNSPQLVHALGARAAVMNNGPRKGGQPDPMQVLHSAPGLQDLWQVHFSELSGQEYTVPGMFISNRADEQPDAMPLAPYVAPADAPPPPAATGPVQPAHDGTAYWFKISARQDGTFTITNTRNGFSKTYAPVQ